MEKRKRIWARVGAWLEGSEEEINRIIEMSKDDEGNYVVDDIEFDDRDIKGLTIIPDGETYIPYNCLEDYLKENPDKRFKDEE